MNKIFKLITLMLVMALSLAVPTSLALASGGGNSATPTVTVEQVCGEGDSGKIDVSDGNKTLTLTAPAGKLIDGYCVKAGSTLQGDGPEYKNVPDAKTVTISHSSGKDISHYSLNYVDVAVTEPTKEPTQEPTKEPTQEPTETPTTKAPEPTEEPTPELPTEQPVPTLVPVPGPTVEDKKVTICHATGSETNPFVEITISENALPAHFSDGHQQDEDTFGPCPTPVPSESVKPSESASPSPTVSPTTSPTASPTVSPTVSPTPVDPCPGVSVIGRAGNASSTPAELTVTVNNEIVESVPAEVAPGELALIGLPELAPGDVVQVFFNNNTGSPGSTDEASAVARADCGVGVEVQIVDFVGPFPEPCPDDQGCDPITCETIGHCSPEPSETPTVIVPHSDTPTVTTLPVTGAGKVLGYVVFGLLLLLAGMFLLGLTRRR